MTDKPIIKYVDYATDFIEQEKKALEQTGKIVKDSAVRSARQ